MVSGRRVGKREGVRGETEITCRILSFSYLALDVLIRLKTISLSPS